MTKRFGFTLAEVLITLGIIGVVAAMTIPTLIANTNGAKFRSQFKKTVSTLNQAGLMSQAQYDYDYAGATTKCTIGTGAEEKPDEVMTFCAILNGTLTGQTYIGASNGLKRNANGEQKDYAWVETKGADGLVNGLKLADTINYTLADGSIVGFHKDAAGCELAIGTQLKDNVITGDLASCVGYIDVNGVTLPNKEVSCGKDAAGADIATTAAVQTPCAVPNDANHMTDIFPIVFHDSTVEPASNAAKYVLTSSK
ncbi:MAG: type II secretion system protein [Candidatus Gastranaerophilaceae bacterium]